MSLSKEELQKRWDKRYPNFTIQEMHSRHGRIAWSRDNRIMIDLLFMDKLQALRDIVGPLQVTSGYRSQRENKLVGGAPSSLHMLGKAADFLQKSMLPSDVVKAAYSVGFTYAKYYPETGHIHVQFDQIP